MPPNSSPSYHHSPQLPPPPPPTSLLPAPPTRLRASPAPPPAQLQLPDVVLSEITKWREGSRWGNNGDEEGLVMAAANCRRRRRRSRREGRRILLTVDRFSIPATGFCLPTAHIDLRFHVPPLLSGLLPSPLFFCIPSLLNGPSLRRLTRRATGDGKAVAMPCSPKAPFIGPYQHPSVLSRTHFFCFVLFRKIPNTSGYCTEAAPESYWYRVLHRVLVHNP